MPHKYAMHIAFEAAHLLETSWDDLGCGEGEVYIDPDVDGQGMPYLSVVMEKPSGNLPDNITVYGRDVYLCVRPLPSGMN